MSKPFPCCQCCSWCEQHGDPWLARFCGPSVSLATAEWTFVSSYTGNQINVDIQNVGEMTVNPFVTGWSIINGTDSGQKIKQARSGLVFPPLDNGAPFPVPYNWTYARPDGNMILSNISFSIAIDHRCGDAVRRVRFNTPTVGYGLMYANYFWSTGPYMGSGGSIAISAWQSSWESTKDCTAILVGDPDSSYAIGPLVNMKVRYKWKPTTETLSC